ncbi:MAG: glycosyltransferase family 4 protein [Hydrococcus sp. Prado102]|jgi:glycosyltransferase involved in cell wall biosynthesis|nr:glycosyltransferase family 4 protein [Hydrococcus sp. Prado102]
MRILTVHNYYQYQGGEEQVFQSESELLEANGHQVWRYTLDNDRIGKMSSLSLLGKTLWNHQVYQELRSLIRQEQIQIAHFHNTFPLISPSAYYACKAEGIPVIQTCHNYRLLCGNGMFLRDGKVCEDCLGKLIPMPSIQHKCYRNSQTASMGVATMLTAHRLANTWNQKVDRYIALTEFARQKLIQGGIPGEKIAVKPNFVDPDPGYGEGNGGYALFVGRLSQEKGIDLLLSAWKQIGDRIPLKIVGDGPLAEQVAAAVNSASNLLWVGRKSMEEVYTLMKGATFLVFPSRWYEGLPRTIIEAFAVGTPVIAPNLGSMSSLIARGETGLHFQAGCMEDLVNSLIWATHHSEAMIRMRQRVRFEFIHKYTAEESYRKLMEIYTQALLITSPKEEIKS